MVMNFDVCEIIKVMKDSLDHIFVKLVHTSGTMNKGPVSKI